MLRSARVALLMTLLWLGVRGRFTAASALQGFLLCFLAIYPLHRLLPEPLPIRRLLRAPHHALFFLLRFLKELILANLQVAYRVLHPALPIDPDIVVYATRLRHPVAITALANAITLTPGTLTLDYDEGTHALFIHGMTGKDREGVLAPIRAWEARLLAIFGDEPAREDA